MDYTKPNELIQIFKAFKNWYDEIWLEKVLSFKFWFMWNTCELGGVSFYCVMSHMNS